MRKMQWGGYMPPVEPIERPITDWTPNKRDLTSASPSKLKRYKILMKSLDTQEKALRALVEGSSATSLLAYLGSADAAVSMVKYKEEYEDIPRKRQEVQAKMDDPHFDPDASSKFTWWTEKK